MKQFCTTIFSILFAFCICITTFAYRCQGNAETSWWYGTNADNTEWYNDGWHWIDDNGDNYAECYYFAPDGYILYVIHVKTANHKYKMQLQQN